MKHSGKHLHIVSFDVPFPANYGGVIDVYYKVKALAERGIKIHLHCFQYGRTKSDRLKELCHEVHYYNRDVSKSQLFKSIPYIITSRSDEQLLKNLQKDKYPILFEGLHTTFFLNEGKLDGRKTIVRTHNIEHDYYNSLARVETNIFKKYYFLNEASKLQQYESVLTKATYIAAISPNDSSYLNSKYKKAKYIPAFHSNEKVNSTTGRGQFAFYHGNLAIGENNEAAFFLVNEVFRQLPVTLIIAGSKPAVELRNAVQRRSNITLLSDLTTKQIHQLIADAHINVLPTFQPTGIKLKLLSALYNGKFCLVNTPMVANTGLEQLCVVKDTASSLKEQCLHLMKNDFNEFDLALRKDILEENFSNTRNVEKLISLVFS